MMKCYLCGCEEYDIRKGKCRDNEFLKICECKKCGLVYLSDFSHIKKDFYQNNGQVKSNNKVKIVNTASIIDTQRRFDEFALLFSNKKVLDFGCGKGDFLMKLKNEGLCSELFSLEINSEYHEVLNKNFTHYSDIDDIEDSSLDIITLFHVLEHLPDPLSILNQLYHKLKDGGKIIIEVPSSDDVLLQTYKSHSFSKFTYWSLHLFLFNTNSLAKLIKKTMFNIVYVKQYQRYSLANHLHWLSEGKPGGHLEYHFLENDLLNQIYSKKLAEIGQCDTIIAQIQKNENTTHS